MSLNNEFNIVKSCYEQHSKGYGESASFSEYSRSQGHTVWKVIYSVKMFRYL